jgi:serine/threonine protein kinase
VVAVYDAGTLGSQVFIAMEFVAGETLQKWLERRHGDWRSVLSVFVDAGRGLAAAHAVGIVHRDFKPDNVLLGKDGRARVTDFGLARPLGGDGETLGERLSSAANGFGDWDLAMKLTHAGMLKGTPAYMAPEQFRFARADARTDQFSFCVALYEGLYGHRPFRANGLESLAKEVLAGRVREAPDAASIPPSLRATVLRGLSVDPEHRYPAMIDLLAALDQKLAERPPGISQRRALVAAAAGAGACLTMAALWLFAIRATPSSRIETPPASSLSGLTLSGSSAVPAPSSSSESAPPVATPTTPTPRVDSSEPIAVTLNNESRESHPRRRVQPRPAARSSAPPKAPSFAASSRVYDDSPADPAFVRKPP